MPDLFPALPEQRPPERLYADQHVLETCAMCRGAGKLEIGSGFEPHVCSWCDGAGARLLKVGRVIDA